MTPQEFFKKDRFADNVGVELIEIKEGYGKARLVITEEHLNAGNRTQGGPSLRWPTLLWQPPPTPMAHSPSRSLPTSHSCAAAVPETRCMPKPANGIPDAAPDITRLTSPTKKESW